MEVAIIRHCEERSDAAVRALFETTCGGDYEAFVAHPAANGVNSVGECIVIGLDPTDPAAKFTANIEMVGGVAHISWSPDLNLAGGRSLRKYEIVRVTPQNGGWAEVSSTVAESGDAVADRPASGGAGLFKVRVSLLNPGLD